MLHIFNKNVTIESEGVYRERMKRVTVRDLHRNVRAIPENSNGKEISESGNEG